MSESFDHPNREIKEAALAYHTAVPVMVPPTEDDLFHGDGKYVSEEEYFQYFYGFKGVSYEWNNGILEAKPMADVAKARMYAWFLRLILAFLETNPIAKFTMLEIGFRMNIPDPKVRGARKTVIRKPDMGIILDENSISLNDDDNTYQGICDLCIESLSNSTQKEIDRDIVQKKREYQDAGVKEYFILDDQNQHMLFYRLNDLGNYVQIKSGPEGVIRSTVLPGFQFRIDDLFNQPTLESVALDPVYSSFLLLDYQKATRQVELERHRAEEERVRAEEERVRAEEERVRAALLAEKLRKLGHDPDLLTS